MSHPAAACDRLRIGLIDSGISPHQQYRLAAARAFPLPEAAVNDIDDWRDRLGHGSALAQILIDQLPEARLWVAKVFDHRLTTGAAQVAEAVDWLVDSGVRLINLSLGLRSDRVVLAKACQRAREAGVVLVAASPAMGGAVYPASYPGVLRVTGDARCQPDEHSWCPSGQADFGACVRTGRSPVVGASVATARISARVGRYLCETVSDLSDPDRLRNWLREQARYQGPQRPFALIPRERRLSWQGGIS